MRPQRLSDPRMHSLLCESLMWMMRALSTMLAWKIAQGHSSFVGAGPSASAATRSNDSKTTNGTAAAVVASPLGLTASSPPSGTETITSTSSMFESFEIDDTIISLGPTTSSDTKASIKQNASAAVHISETMMSAISTSSIDYCFEAVGLADGNIAFEACEAGSLDEVPTSFTSLAGGITYVIEGRPSSLQALDILLVIGSVDHESTSSCPQKHSTSSETITTTDPMMKEQLEEDAGPYRFPCGWVKVWGKPFYIDCGNAPLRTITAPAVVPPGPIATDPRPPPRQADMIRALTSPMVEGALEHIADAQMTSHASRDVRFGFHQWLMVSLVLCLLMWLTSGYALPILRPDGQTDTSLPPASGHVMLPQATRNGSPALNDTTIHKGGAGGHDGGGGGERGSESGRSGSNGGTGGGCIGCAAGAAANGSASDTYSPRLLALILPVLAPLVPVTSSSAEETGIDSNKDAGTSVNPGESTLSPAPGLPLIGSGNDTHLVNIKPRMGVAAAGVAMLLGGCSDVAGISVEGLPVVVTAAVLT